MEVGQGTNWGCSAQGKKNISLSMMGYYFYIFCGWSEFSMKLCLQWTDMDYD
jgi:hypothetical protein